MSCLRGWVKLKAGCISINSERDVLNFIVVTLRTKKKKLNIIQHIFWIILRKINSEFGPQHLLYSSILCIYYLILMNAETKNSLVSVSLV